MKKAVVLLILLLFVLIPLIGYMVGNLALGWEIITDTLGRWISGENMMRDVQYWLTPWTVSDTA